MILSIILINRWLLVVTRGYSYENTVGHTHTNGYSQGRRNWGGRRGSCPPCLLLGGARGAKVPFKYKEYYVTVSFQGAFS